MVIVFGTLIGKEVILMNMVKIANAIKVVKNVLESNHPKDTVKSLDSGSCDFRVTSSGPSVMVIEKNNSIVTDTDISDIEELSKEKIYMYHLKHVPSSGDKVKFTLQ